MKLAASLTLVASLATVAAAQPAPTRRAFATATSFSTCTESWAFMCRIPSGNGHYGTARKMQHCTTYSFAPDGTYTITADMPRIGHGGTYRIVGPRVILTQQNVDGTTEKTELPLSKDQSTLGPLTRVP